MRRSIAGNAVILVASGFIVRLLGFVYRVFLSNLMGAEGMGLYQLISPIYLLVILTLTSGISTAVSRIVSRENALRRTENSRRYMWSAFLLSAAAGVIFGALMYFGSGFLASGILSDPRAKNSFMVLASCIPVVCTSTAVKGYFYGIQDMMPNAFAQLVEQIVRIATTYALISALGSASTGLDTGVACSYAMIGSIAGEASSFMIVFLTYAFRRRGSKKREQLTGRRKAVCEIIRTATPVSANRFITTLMATVETILIPRQLAAGGLGVRESMEVLGRFNGMAMPLIMFPAIFTSSLAVTLVPAISEAVARRDMRTVNARASGAIKFTASFGILFTAFFLFFPEDIAGLAYKGENVGGTIRVLAYSCLFIYLGQTLNGILNGLGRQNILFRNALICYGIRIAAVWFAVPLYGIMAYVAAVAGSLVISCILNIKVTMKDTGMPLDLRSWILKPSLAAAAVYAIKKASLLLPSVIMMPSGLNSVVAMIAPVLALAAGIALLIVTKSVSFNIRLTKKIRSPASSQLEIKQK